MGAGAGTERIYSTELSWGWQNSLNRVAKLLIKSLYQPELWYQPEPIRIRAGITKIHLVNRPSAQPGSNTSTKSHCCPQLCPLPGHSIVPFPAKGTAAAHRAPAPCGHQGHRGSSSLAASKTRFLFAQTPSLSVHSYSLGLQMYPWPLDIPREGEQKQGAPAAFLSWSSYLLSAACKGRGCEKCEPAGPLTETYEVLALSRSRSPFHTRQKSLVPVTEMFAED